MKNLYQQHQISKKNKSFLELIEESTIKYPNNKSVQYEGKTLSYLELEEQSNLYCYYLQKIGLRKKDKVCVHLNSCIEFLPLVLGILKNGCIYVPVDKDIPLIRLTYIISNCLPQLLITYKENLSIDDRNIKVINLASINRDITKNTNTSAKKIELSPKDSAYIIYTSGSTGNPKGVEICHGSLLNRLIWQKDCFNLSEDDIILHKASKGFDVSIWELFWGLIKGAKTVFSSNETIRDFSKLEYLVKSERISVVHFVPSALNLFLQKKDFKDSNLRIVVCSGEALDLSLKNLFFQKVDSKTKLYNLYGPTEATIDITFYEVQKGDYKIPIGKAIYNNDVYVLDEKLKQKKIDEIGEIYLSGVGIARGYVNNKKLTDESFFEDPFKKNIKMYKTGDLGYFSGNGDLFYVGRKDNQIKINGLRIELEEIEQVLLKCNEINSSVVVSKKSGNHEILIAYYTLKKNSFIDNAAIKHEISKYLPYYMIPSYFIILDELPMLSNNKVDRKHLKNLDFENLDILESSVESKEQSENIKKNIHNIFKTVLNITHIEKCASFFTVGGDSILAIKLVSRINSKYKVDISLAEFFENSSINSMSAFISKKLKESGLIEPSKQTKKKIFYDQNQSEHTLPLSMFQKSIWITEKMIPNTTTFNYPLFLKLTGKINRSILHKTVSLLFQKHRLLNSRIYIDNDFNINIESNNQDTFIEYIYPQEEKKSKTKTISLKSISDYNLYTQDFSSYLKTLIDDELNKPFDLEKDVLGRVKIIPLITIDDTMSEDEFYLFFTFHHIIFDDSSKDILIKDLVNIYQKLLSSDTNNANLTILNNKKEDNIIYNSNIQNNDENSENDIIYWESQIKGYKDFNLLFTKKRPRYISYEGEIFQKILELDDINFLVKKYETSLFSILLTLFKISLSRFSDDSDIIVGIPVTVRKYPEQENKIGYFLNSIPIKTKLSKKLQTELKYNRNVYETTFFHEYLEEVRANLLEGISHKNTPFETIVERLKIRRDTTKHPIFQIMFNFWAAPNISKVNTESLPFHMENLNVYNGNSKFDFTLHIKAYKSTLLLTYEYRKDLFYEKDIKKLSKSFENSINKLVFLNKHSLVKDYKLDTKSPIKKVNGITFENSEVVDSNSLSRKQLQKILLKIWQKLLNTEKISINDNFFDVGGNSFLIIQMQHLIKKELDFNIRVLDLFANPSVGRLSKFIENQNLILANTT